MKILLKKPVYDKLPKLSNAESVHYLDGQPEACMANEVKYLPLLCRTSNLDLQSRMQVENHSLHHLKARTLKKKLSSLNNTRVIQ